MRLIDDELIMSTYCAASSTAIIKFAVGRVKKSGKQLKGWRPDFSDHEKAQIHAFLSAKVNY